MKKILSLLLSAVVFVTGLGAYTACVSAATYSAQLKSAGFPDSYVSYLTSLHEKYPNWTFKAYKTGLDWSTAVSGERSTHSNQLIQKQSSLPTGYYCNCSSCYKNGSYVVREGSSWIAASESALKYYMDPRNWLSEKYIFQFESTAYDSSQTKSGVEAILNGTWMYKNTISYKDTAGNTKTYDSSTKYSDAIIAAAKNSKMSAYYLASKIKQENGSSSPTPTAVCGTKAPFQGIYNYFNIGAYNGASDGLAWAAGFMKLESNTTLYKSYNSTTKTVSTSLGTIKAGQYMTYRADAGNYYYVRLYTETGANQYTEGKSGYVAKSAVRTRYLNNGRPWTNPYKAIYYGAAYIASSFTNQSTGYLQKFNVTSSSRYSNEYMRNIQGAASEASIAYTAYKNAGLLSAAKTFYIPVFNNMPSSKCAAPTSDTTPLSAPSKVSGLKVSSTSSTAVKLKWSKVSGASGYYVYSYDSSKKKYKKIASTTSNSKKISSLSSGKKYYYAVAAYKTKNSQTKTGSKSSKVKAVTKPKKVTLSSLSAKKGGKIKASWKKVGGSASGYQIYWARDSKFKKVVAKTTVKKQSSKSYTGKNFDKGKKYYVKVRAYKTVDGKKYYGSWSKTKSVKAK